ncbi:MAG TPA: DUF465 domain-containing protein [Azoarcus sp.]|nr:DUF465 domain-containing protein [Azoarcus sp.]
MSSNLTEFETLRARLVELRAEHGDLDSAIDQLDKVPPEDMLLTRRLKKRRLALKDRIRALERIIEPGDFA